MMDQRPYPPPPEPGWHPDDNEHPRSSRTDHPPYHLSNATTGQHIIIDRDTLLGRNPTMPASGAMTIARIDDPTRTVSRNHAIISVTTSVPATAGSPLRIEDLNSLNGTTVRYGNHDTALRAGEPTPLAAPATIRFGDLYFQLTTGNQPHTHQPHTHQPAWRSGS